MTDSLLIGGRTLGLDEALALGSSHFQQGRVAEAEAVYKEILRLHPDQPRALHALGVVSHRLGRGEMGVELVRRAVTLQPDFADAHNNLGNILKELGRIAEAIESYRKATVARPGFAAAHSNLLLCMHYLPGFSPAEIFRESLRFADLLPEGRGSAPVPVPREPDPFRRLRVGYLSPDFREHSVSYFFAPLLRAHDRSRVEVFCYADLPAGDAVTGRLRGLSDRWREIFSSPDREVVESIKGDGIDILVDLAGHTGRNRLGIFASKAAPIQVSWLGYPDTTGLSAVDYRLTDGVADPGEDGDSFYTERLVRLRAPFLCYEPPATAPPCAPLPSLEKGFVTFGSFNSLAKLTPQVLALWSELLSLVPRSRLLLKNPSLGHEAARRRCLELLCRNGVREERIDLLPFASTTEEHLRLYHQVDISLDTFPYNGTTTTCESLWMGVPAITVKGKSHAARVGATLLKSVGLEELVAESPEGYLEIAAGLAREPRRLARLRGELRERVSSSPLCDARSFAGEVEKVYREMWLKLLGM